MTIRTICVRNFPIYYMQVYTIILRQTLLLESGLKSGLSESGLLESILKSGLLLSGLFSGKKMSRDCWSRHYCPHSAIYGNLRQTLINRIDSWVVVTSLSLSAFLMCCAMNSTPLRAVFTLWEAFLYLFTCKQSIHHVKFIKYKLNLVIMNTRL